MHCPFCRNPDSRVVDSREADEGQAIRRRRSCPECGRRFTTVETAVLAVVKQHRAEVRIEAAGGIAREDADLFQTVAGSVAAAEGRHQTEQALRSRRAHNLPKRIVNFAARQRRQRFLHHTDALAHRQELFDLVLVENQHLRHRIGAYNQ